MPKRADHGSHRRADSTQVEQVKAARKVGAFVVLTSSQGNGFPDAVIAFRGRWTLHEFKGAKGTLTNLQRKFVEDAAAAGCTVHVTRTGEELLKAIGAA